jgi:hypothetical protein
VQAAYGTKRTCEPPRLISAFEGKADSRWTPRHPGRDRAPLTRVPAARPLSCRRVSAYLPQKARQGARVVHDSRLPRVVK